MTITRSGWSPLLEIECFAPGGKYVKSCLRSSLNLIFVVQEAATFDHEINLFLSVVGHGLAITMSIQSDFSEASYGLQRSILLVPLAKDRPVVASFSSEIALRLHQSGT